MRRYIVALALVGMLVACGGKGGGTKPPNHGGGIPLPPKPPQGQRMTLAQLKERQRFAMDHVHSPYKEVRKAMDLARGGHVDLNGIGVSFWEWAMPWYVYVNGDEAAKNQVRDYFRQYLKCESGSGDPICQYGKGNYLQSSANCSANHQARRWGSVYAATQVLGEAEALKYGTPDKVRNAKRNWIDVIQGRGWRDPYGNLITEGPCATNVNIGDHPEIARSRHYMGRVWTYLQATAELSNDPEMKTAASDALDRAVRQMRPGVMATCMLDETALPQFRSDSSTRCPSYCEDVLRKYHQSCGPGESPAIVYVLFDHGKGADGNPASMTWPPEFGGNDPRCNDGDQFFLYGWYLFTAWKPLLK